MCLFSPSYFFTMNIGCWNIRGLNDPLKHLEMHHLIRHHRVTFFGLVETQVRKSSKDNVSRFFFLICGLTIINLLVVVNLTLLGSK